MWECENLEMWECGNVFPLFIEFGGCKTGFYFF